MLALASRSSRCVGAEFSPRDPSHFLALGSYPSLNRGSGRLRTNTRKLAIRADTSVLRLLSSLPSSLSVLQQPSLPELSWRRPSLWKLSSQPLSWPLSLPPTSLPLSCRCVFL